MCIAPRVAISRWMFRAFPPLKIYRETRRMKFPAKRRYENVASVPFASSSTFSSLRYPIFCFLAASKMVQNAKGKSRRRLANRHMYNSEDKCNPLSAGAIEFYSFIPRGLYPYRCVSVNRETGVRARARGRAYFSKLTDGKALSAAFRGRETISEGGSKARNNSARAAARIKLRASIRLSSQHRVRARALSLESNSLSRFSFFLLFTVRPLLRAIRR